MESSSRMRRCLRRNYRGSDHFGAAANYEEHIDIKEDQDNVINSSNAPILAAEAISMDAVNEDDDQVEVDNLDGMPYGEETGVNQSRVSMTTEQTPAVPTERSDIRLPNDQDFIENSPAVSSGYVPGEHDERIVLELPSAMVQPLRVIHGTFQVCMMSILSYILASHAMFLIRTGIFI